MSSQVLIYTGAVISLTWGIAHFVPAVPVENGFGDLSVNNRRIVVRELVSGGIDMFFMSLPVLVLTAGFGLDDGGMIFTQCLLSGWLSVVALKLCPQAKTICALLIYRGRVGYGTGWPGGL